VFPSSGLDDLLPPRSSVDPHGCMHRGLGRQLLYEATPPVVAQYCHQPRPAGPMASRPGVAKSAPVRGAAPCDGLARSRSASSWTATRLSAVSPVKKKEKKSSASQLRKLVDSRPVGPRSAPLGRENNFTRGLRRDSVADRLIAPDLRRWPSRGAAEVEHADRSERFHDHSHVVLDVARGPPVQVVDVEDEAAMSSFSSLSYRHRLVEAAARRRFMHAPPASPTPSGSVAKAPTALFHRLDLQDVDDLLHHSLSRIRWCWRGVFFFVILIRQPAFCAHRDVPSSMRFSRHASCAGTSRCSGTWRAIRAWRRAPASADHIVVAPLPHR